MLGVATLLGAVAALLRQSPILGYLLTGVVLGPAGLNILGPGQGLEALAELGVALLLFLIGLDFSLFQLRRFGPIGLWGGMLQVTATFLVTAWLAWLIGTGLRTALAIAAIVPLSSTAVVIQELANRAKLDSQHGRNTVAVQLFQDLAVIPLVLLVAALGKPSPPMSIAAQFALSFAVTLAFAVGLLAVVRYVVAPLLTGSHLLRYRDFPILVAITTVVLTAWVARELGVSPILGSFLAGVLLAETPFAEQLRADLMPFRAAFVTVFFGSVGLLLQSIGLGHLGPIVLLAVGLVVLKATVASLVFVVLKRPLDEALRSGLCLAQIGEFSFVLASVATRTQLLTPELFQSFLMASIITLALTPWLVALAGRLPGSSQILELQPPENITAQSPEAIIVGLGPAGQAVCCALRQRGVRVSVIELNLRTVERFQNEFPILLGDARQASILLAAGLASAKVLVVTLPDPATCVQIIEVARRLAPSVRILARARYHIYAPQLVAAGADLLANEEDLVGQELAELAIRELGAGPASV